jgi:peroxiredoxin
MRPVDDQGWKARMIAFQTLLKHGDQAIDGIRDRLQQGTPVERAMAAQSLGFLRAMPAKDDLLGALQRDSEPLVRLYAADALGMLGAKPSDIDWQQLAARETNRDVKRHIEYVPARAGKALADAVVKQLLDWDVRAADSARLGEPAPDFELPSLAGEKVRLRDFVGKKAVVLVFFYGDTCPVCHMQLGQLRSRLGDIEALGAQVIAIDPHEAYSARFFLKGIGPEASDLHYPLLLDPAHVVSATYGVAFQNRVHTELSNRPATFVIDRSGVIRYARRAATFSDRPTPDEILSELKKLASR